MRAMPRLALICVLSTVLTAVLGDDLECIDYDHPNYGYSGQCIDTSECPGNKYISNLCPSYGNSIKCCFTVGSDEECPSYNRPTYGNVGYCVHKDRCPNGNHVSNKCPTLAAAIKCCFSKPDCDSVRIVTRAEWGARSPTSTNNLPSPAQYAFIHHTAGNACDTESDCSAIVRGIQNYHMDTKGWADIGYSFLVGGDGNIYEGRGWDREGAHTAGYNTVGLAWSFIGSFTSQLPYAKARYAAQCVIERGVTLGKLTSTYTLRGHRDMGSTSCPGDTLYAEIQQWPHY